MSDLNSSFKFHAPKQSLNSGFVKNGQESEGMVQEMNEHPYSFEMVFSDSMHVLK